MNRPPASGPWWPIPNDSTPPPRCSFPRPRGSSVVIWHITEAPRPVLLSSSGATPDWALPFSPGSARAPLPTGAGRSLSDAIGNSRLAPPVHRHRSRTVLSTSHHQIGVALDRQCRPRARCVACCWCRRFSRHHHARAPVRCASRSCSTSRRHPHALVPQPPPVLSMAPRLPPARPRGVHGGDGRSQRSRKDVEHLCAGLLSLVRRSLLQLYVGSARNAACLCDELVHTRATSSGRRSHRRSVASVS